ncbi:hypothetical protein [Microbacterium sp. 13-71-7]|jgi:hypothetical protein|nr:hypothetical protein [Microbacterium sp. 13-71-7]
MTFDANDANAVADHGCKVPKRHQPGEASPLPTVAAGGDAA